MELLELSPRNHDGILAAFTFFQFFGTIIFMILLLCAMLSCIFIFDPKNEIAIYSK